MISPRDAEVRTGLPEAVPAAPVQDQRRDAAVARSQAAWQDLGKSVRTVTPSGLARTGLVLGALSALGWLISASWPAPMPFIIGAVIAYTVLPIANGLDKFMPRFLAAFLSVLGAFGLIVLVLAALAAPIVAEVVAFIQDFPAREEIQAGVAGLNQYIAALPEPVQVAVRDSATQTLGNVRNFLQGMLVSFPEIGFQAVFGLLNAVGVVLGLLVIPSWILIVVRDQPVGVRAANRVLPAWMRPDLFAAVRIVDQSLGLFMRGLIGQALVVGVLTYAGLRSLELLGFDRVLYPVPLATLAAVLNLVPVVGPLVSGLVAVLVGLISSPAAAVAILGVYVGVQMLASWLIGSRIQGRLVNIHPGVLAVVAVALSQLGLAWALLTIPIVAISRDLFQYAYGRVSDPPRPAGLLPGMRSPAANTTTASSARLVYRRGRGQRGGEAPQV